jgi:hypothetical protein
VEDKPHFKYCNVIMTTNIPTHDPYTGELNPYYEELTGNINPLNKSRRNTNIKLDSLNDILIQLAYNDNLDYESKILSLERYLKVIK